MTMPSANIPVAAQATTVGGAARPLLGHVVVFTGRLASMSRARADEAARRAGAVVATSVTSRTTRVIVGMHGWPLLADGSPTKALRDAEALRARRRPVVIMGEEAFLELVGERQRCECLTKSYELAHVSAVTGLSPATITLWEGLGLVRSALDRYDFRDIVSLQTIARLLREGVDLRTIKKSVTALAAILPGAERPLAQLEMVAQDPGGLLAARLGDSLIDAHGQFRLPFGDAAAGAPNRSIAQAATPHPDDDAEVARPTAATDDDLPPILRLVEHLPKSAQQWIESGLAAEEEERQSDAEEFYRHAIEADPAAAAAQFNLGNVLLAQGRRAAAEERFRQALAIDPGFSPALFNLAAALEDQGQAREAVAVLERCIQTDASFADAYFNLAELLERLGERQRAQPIYRAFLRLEPGGEWAERAKRKLQ